MSLSIYGEVAIDWLVSQNGSITYRIGGAGLYAALSVASIGKKSELLTVLGPDINEYFISVWSDIGVSFQYTKKDDNYNIPRYLVTGFENYCKKLSRPMANIKNNNSYSPKLPQESEGILLFPINHSIPKDICIEAKRNNKLVFLDPKPNQESIEDAIRLLEYVDVLLVNEEEILLVSSKKDVVEAIQALHELGPKHIIVKRGVRGSIIAERGKELIIVPSYKSNAICTLGSGDVFGGALAATFIETGDMEYSVKFASCMAACFIENFEIESMPSKKAVEYYLKNKETHDYSSLKNLVVYLAAPFFCQQELSWVSYIHQSLESCGLIILSPSKENGIINADTTIVDRKSIFNLDLELIDRADIVVALLDHNDTGTSFEIGYAFSKGKPVIGLKTFEVELNNMLEYGCNSICFSVDKLISEVFTYAKK